MGLQETYVDTIDVAPSNFSITEGYSYSAPRRDAALNRSTVFVFRAATSSCTTHVAPSLDIRIFIREIVTGCKILHKSSRADYGELANCLIYSTSSSSLPTANASLHAIEIIFRLIVNLSILPWKTRLSFPETFEEFEDVVL